MDVQLGGQCTRPAPMRALIGLLVPAALAAASAVLVWAAAAPIGAVRAPGPAPVDALLALGAALGCAALLALAAVGATLSLAAVVTGQAAGRLGALARLLTPGAVRVAVGLAVGVTVATGPVCLATGGAGHPVAVAVADQRTVLPPGWSPDRPAVADPGTRAPTQGSVASQPRRPGSVPLAGTARSTRADRVTGVLVRTGDTLWAIAARHLGPGATTARVAAEWPRWYATNRPTIGRDPDLILPGQRLATPHGRARDGRGPNDPQKSRPTE
jgi:hypothetical protein